MTNPQVPVHSEGCVDSLCIPREVRINASSVSSSLSSPTSLIVNLSSDFLPNVSFRALVDSGSTHCFIESAFVRKHNHSTRSVSPISLRLFDGTTNAIITESVELPIQFPHGHTQCKIYGISYYNVMWPLWPHSYSLYNMGPYRHGPTI